MLKKLYHILARPVLRELELLKLNSVISISLARAAATATMRMLDYSNPTSWEFSGFSQNGEDGIIDVLLRKLKESNKYFIEIGASNGLENNTAWLAHAKKFKGLMIDGDLGLVKQGHLVKQWLVLFEQLFISIDNVQSLDKFVLYKTPDLLSVDIDGNDFYIVQKLLELDYRPKIFVVEFNSAFGPENRCTIKYDPTFNVFTKTKEQLYYGVSINGWKEFFKSYGYKFITVESNGVNAFFVDPKWFDSEFLSGIKAVEFQENCHQERKFKTDWKGQFELIKNLELVKI